MSLTPQQIEKRLYELSKEIDEAHEDYKKDEVEFHTTTAEYEIAMAKSRIKNSHGDMKMTVRMSEDTALVENQELHRALAICEAKVKASRANNNRLRTQVDTARSISSSIKSSMEL